MIQTIGLNFELSIGNNTEIEKILIENLGSKENGTCKIWDLIEDDNNSNWTKAINEILRSSLRSAFGSSNYLYAASKNKMAEEADNGEWLYDFICYEESEHGLENIVLIAESEWMNSYSKNYWAELKYDFEKLVQARSQHKLMIFEGHNENEIRTYIEKFNTIVSKCRLSQLNDRYMYVAWDKKQQKFYIEVYTINPIKPAL